MNAGKSTLKANYSTWCCPCKVVAKKRQVTRVRCGVSGNHGAEPRGSLGGSASAGLNPVARCEEAPLRGGKFSWLVVLKCEHNELPGLCPAVGSIEYSSVEEDVFYQRRLCYVACVENKKSELV